MFDVHFFAGLAALIVGNILVRCAYELFVLFFSIHINLNVVTDKIMGRPAEEEQAVTMKEFFGEMGSQIKTQQAKIKVRQDEKRAREEAYRRMYDQPGGPEQINAAPGSAPLAGPPAAGYPQAAAGTGVDPAPAYPQAPTGTETAPAPAAAPTPAFCGKCGGHLDNAGAFCPKCGAPVR